MFKVFFVVFLLAVPAFCAIIQSGREEQEIERIFEDYFKEKCKNVSGLEVNVEKIEQQTQEYFACTMEAVNMKQIQQDLRAAVPALMPYRNWNSPSPDFQNSTIAPLIEKYCPLMNKSAICGDKLSSIYEECCTTEEQHGKKINTDLHFRINDFFCENNAENVWKFLNGKAIECLFIQRSASEACLHQYMHQLFQYDSQQSVDYHKILQAFWPKAKTVCGSMYTLSNCLAPILKQCELSTTAGPLIESFLTHLNTKSLCGEYIRALVQ